MSVLSNMGERLRDVVDYEQRTLPRKEGDCSVDYREVVGSSYKIVATK